jgi:hypothetical protein
MAIGDTKNPAAFSSCRSGMSFAQRALNDEHTIHDQQRIQWMAQAYFGALDIYQEGVSICSVSREEIIEEIEDWFAEQSDDLAAALFATVVTGD